MKILVHELLTASTEARPNAPFLLFGDDRRSFERVDQDSDRLAVALQEDGLRKGDRVALLLENSVDLVASVFGVLKAGGVFVLLHPSTKPKKLQYILNDCAVRQAIVDARLAPVVDEAHAESVRSIFWVGEEIPRPGRLMSAIVAGRHHPPRDPGLIDQDLAAVIYTSGSTGDPKGVMLTHRNMANTAWAISTYLKNVPEDVVLCALPISFGYGLYQIITGARVGFSVQIECSFAYPQRVLENAVRARVTGIPGVPTIFATLLQMRSFHNSELPSVRYLTNAAAALPPAHIRQLRALFPRAEIFSMYGLTECTRVSYLAPNLIDSHPTSVGRAMPNSEVYVVDDRGRRLPNGSAGELVIRGANVMRGYWGKPQETAATLRDGEIEGERILHTGDVFSIDSDGLLYFLGRTDDIIKCRGEKVSPKEIENVLCELPAIAEAAVIGIEDPMDGQAIKAVVVPRAGHELTDDIVRRHCRGNLEPSLVPKIVEIRTVLPKTVTGKVQKSALR